MSQGLAYHQYRDLLAKQTGRVKKDVETLRVRLQKVAGCLNHLVCEEEKITKDLIHVRKDQCTLHERVEEARKKLKHCKSLLASKLA